MTTCSVFIFHFFLIFENIRTKKNVCLKIVNFFHKVCPVVCPKGARRGFGQKPTLLLKPNTKHSLHIHGVHQTSPNFGFGPHI
jgi:hypothetical protein